MTVAYPYPDDAVGTIDVCVDCLFILANGECEPDRQDEVLEGLARNWPAPLWLVPGCGSDCCGDESDPWFSWQSCDGCGSQLGGNRVHATWFDESKRVAVQLVSRSFSGKENE